MLSFLTYLSGVFAAALLLGMLVPIGLILARPTFILTTLIFAFSLLPFGGGESNLAAGSLYRQITWGFIFLYSLYLAIHTETGRYRLPLELIPIPLMLLLTYILISITWSPLPAVSAKRALQTLGVVLIALALVHKRHTAPYGLRTELFNPVSIFLLLGFSTIALDPALAFGTYHGFEGITSQKNTWGEFSLIGAVVMLVSILANERRRRAWFLLILFSLSVFLSKSATSIAAYLFAIGIVLTWKVIDTRSAVGKALVSAAPFLVIISIALYLLITGDWPFTKLVDFAFSSLGRSTTLTGRTYLWMLMIRQIAHHPWFGIGYGGFWLGMQGPSARVITHLNWGPPVQAHDGYLDILNELGVAGLSLLIVVFFFHFRNIFRLYAQGEKFESLFHFAMIMCCLLLNIAESTLVRTTQMWWIILTVSIVEIHTRLRRIQSDDALGASIDPASVSRWHHNG